MVSTSSGHQRTSLPRRPSCVQSGDPDFEVSTPPVIQLYITSINTAVIQPEEHLRQGPYESQLTMEPFAIHVSTFSINVDPWLVEDFARPVGTVALAITAVSHLIFPDIAY
jgi:hypothetical protein